MTLSPALPGERIRLTGPAGPMVVHVAGDGPPLLLLHSINAAASAAEMRPLHERAAATHKLFTPDLPGYGDSDRSDRRYTPRLMTDAVLAVADLVRGRCGAAPDAVALSLSCEFLARAAVEQPAAVGRLALISPTGFNGQAARRGATGSTREVPGLLRALRGPGWGGALFRGLTRPGVVRFFLRKTWGSPTIDETLWAEAVRQARAPGAEHAPLQFLSGAMFSADIDAVYDAVTQPVWVVHGTRGDFTDYRRLDRMIGRPNWRVDVLDSGAMPHFEPASGFDARFDAWRAEARQAR
jgi:pimeloyl-ACP methyl ester carboxylesterase